MNVSNLACRGLYVPTGLQYIEAGTFSMPSLSEAECKPMVVTCCEVVWLLQLFKRMSLKKLITVTLECDNQAARHIASKCQPSTS